MRVPTRSDRADRAHARDALPGALAGSAQSQLFRVNVPDSRSLLVTLQDGHAADHNELYLQYGTPPTRSEYQYRFSNVAAANQQVVALRGDTRDVVHPGLRRPGPQAQRLHADGDRPPASTYSESLRIAPGTRRMSTSTLTGAGFQSGTTVSLIATNGTTYPLPPPGRRLADPD